MDAGKAVSENVIDIEKRKIQVADGHYLGSYESLPMWINHWHQIQTVLKLSRKSVLEIGHGNGVVSYFLKKCGLDVLTCDIDNRNSPDKLGEVTNLPFGNKTFDIVLCCEVLEHIPYNEFKIALNEIYRVTKEFTVISIPAPFVGVAVAINLPRLPIFKFHLGLRYFAKKQFDGEHYWELGRAGYSLQCIKENIRDAGFDIIDEFRPPLSLFCYFFTLKKSKDHHG